MSINWGIALGSAMQQGLSTYERLGEEELRSMQRQRLKKEMADEAALDLAWKQTQGRVGQQDDYASAIGSTGNTNYAAAQMLSNQGAMPGNTPEDQAFEKASAESAAGALRENAVRQGAIPQDKAALPEVTPTAYTAGQGMKDYVKAAGQVSRKGSLEALQMKKVMRESELEDKFDMAQSKLNDTLSLIHGTAQSGGLKGLADAAKKEGLKVEYVEGKNGVGGRINVLGPKGDVLETVTDLNTATSKLENLAMQTFNNVAVSLLGSPDKVVSYMQGERQIGIKEREVGVKEAIAPSEIAKNYGVAGYYSAGGSAMNRPPKKEVTNSDFNNFLKDFGDKPSSVIDKKSGLPKPVSALTSDQQWIEARKHYNAGGAAFAEDGDRPPIPKGGLVDPAKEKKQSALPMDKTAVAARESEARLSQIMNARRIAFVGPNDYKKLAEDPTAPADVRNLAAQKYQDFVAAQSE